MKTNLVLDPEVPYGKIQDLDANNLPHSLKFSVFERFSASTPFDLSRWSVFLHLSERTLQRYKKEKKSFEFLHTERIFEIAMVIKKGKEVFGNSGRFFSWLQEPNIALGKVIPSKLLESSLGIKLLNQELSRIEHGIFA